MSRVRFPPPAPALTDCIPDVMPAHSRSKNGVASLAYAGIDVFGR
jgi:hypothetical protein